MTTTGCEPAMGSTRADEDAQAQYAQLAVILCALGGALLLVLSESLRLAWPATRLALFLILLPLAFVGAQWKLRRIADGLLAVSLGVAAWLAWLATGSEYVWLFLIAPVMTITLLIDPRLGWGAAAVVSVWLAWRLPLWQPTSALLCAMALLALWSAQAAVWAAARGAAASIDWAVEHHEAMRAVMDAALDQRVELKQARDDLVQANLQLERLAERLAVMTEVAQEANRTKERFLANVSHELRTPLNMIIGFSELITRSPDVYEAELPGALLSDIMVIRRNSQHLASLVDDILDLSRTEAGQMALTREWVSLDEIAQEAINAVRPLFTTKGLYLRVVSDPDLPEVYCDRTRIRQVILNLLSNAGRFTSSGGVQITLSSDAQGAVCCVADTGTGIPSEDRERIFEPFYQTGSQTLMRREGTGLGLSISRSLVELHGGSMELESEIGQGSTFRFRLPLVQSRQQTAQPLTRWFSAYDTYEERDRPTRAPHPHPRPRLVVLEAGTALAKALRRHAGDAEVAGVRSMQQAVAELGREPADALIVNDAAAQSVAQQLPGLDHLPHGTPAVVCWMPADEEVAAELGVTRYLVKPISRDELLACLDEYDQGLGTILIVDDDTEAVQMLARMILSTHRDYQVLRATSPRRALDLMRDRHPDLVLLDMYMPEMSGFELLRFKAQDPSIAHIRVIAVSAHDPTMSLSRGRSLTLVHQEPLSVQDLLNGAQQLRASVVRGSTSAPRESAETHPG